MKRLGSVVLLELCIAAMIFLVSCVTAVQLFVDAHQMNRDTQARTNAMLIAQNCAEQLSVSKEMEATLLENGYVPMDNGIYEQALEEMTMRVELAQQDTQSGTLTQAKISVLQGERLLAQLPAARYYNKEVIHP